MRYVNKHPVSSFYDQLMQLMFLTWDGDLISKSDRDQLVKKGLAVRFGNGWNIITETGVAFLERKDYIHP
jgi:hypothetical protein